MLFTNQNIHNSFIGIAPVMAGAWESWVIYLFMISSYIPGLLLLYRYQFLLRFPLISFFFIGLFIFHAVGAWIVLISPFAVTGAFLFSEAYVWNVFLKPLPFYLCFAIYWKLKHAKGGIDAVKTAVGDLEFTHINRFVVALLAMMLGILTLYYVNVNDFMLFHLFDGSLDHESVLEHRISITVGQKYYSLYRYGFLILPMLIAIISTMNLYCLGWKKGWCFGALLLLCFTVPLLNANKAGVLMVALSVIIAYFYLRAIHGHNPVIRFGLRELLFGVAIIVPTMLIIQVYYAGAPIDLIGKFEVLGFRIFGAYSQSIAGSVAMVQQNGFYGGTTLPTIHGLLPATQTIIEWDVHQFIAGRQGSIPVPAVTEGYINFGWMGFFLFAFIIAATLIIFEEILSRMGMIGRVLLVLYGYFAVMLSTTGYFQALGSLTTTAAIILLLIFYGLLCQAAKLLSRRSVHEH